MTNTRMTEQDYTLFNTRNLKSEIHKVFNILNDRAKLAYGAERDNLRAAVERLQMLSRTNDADAMSEALANFHKLEAKAQNKPAISEHSYNIQLQERLEKAHRESR